MENKYPTRDCTIMDTYLIDNGWKLQPVINPMTKRDISRDYFSTMGLIHRSYVKEDEIVAIGIMLTNVPIHVGYRKNKQRMQFYYMPGENPEEFLSNIRKRKIEDIITILYKRRAVDNLGASIIITN